MLQKMSYYYQVLFSDNNGKEEEITVHKWKPVENIRDLNFIKEEEEGKPAYTALEVLSATISLYEIITEHLEQHVQTLNESRKENK